MTIIEKISLYKDYVTFRKTCYVIQVVNYQILIYETTYDSKPVNEPA